MAQHVQTAASPQNGASPTLSISVQVPAGHNVVSGPQGLLVVDGQGVVRGVIPYSQLFGNAQVMSQQIPAPAAQPSALLPMIASAPSVQFLPSSPAVPQTATFHAQHSDAARASMVAVPLPGGIPVIPLSQQGLSLNSNVALGNSTTLTPTATTFTVSGMSALPNLIAPYSNTVSTTPTLAGPVRPAMQPQAAEPYVSTGSSPGLQSGFLVAGAGAVALGRGQREPTPNMVSNASIAVAAAQEAIASHTAYSARPRVLELSCTASSDGTAGTSRSATFSLSARLALDLLLENGSHAQVKDCNPSAVAAGTSVLSGYQYKVVFRVVRRTAPLPIPQQLAAIQAQVSEGQKSSSEKDVPSIAPQGKAKAKAAKEKDSKVKEALAIDPIDLLAQAWCSSARSVGGDGSGNGAAGVNAIAQHWQIATDLSITQKKESSSFLVGSSKTSFSAPRGYRVDCAVLACRSASSDGVSTSGQGWQVQPVPGRCLFVGLCSGESECVAPGPVSALSVGDAAKTSLTVRWSAPVHDGGQEVVRYEVQATQGQVQPAVESAWATVYEGPDRSYEYKRLSPGCWYSFRVRAGTASGVGAWSDVRGCTEARVPFPPGPPTCKATTSSSLCLQWEKVAPPADGGSAVTEWLLEWCAGVPHPSYVAYQLERGEGDGTDGLKAQAKGVSHGLTFVPVRVEGSALTYTLSGLSPETAYSFRLHASNAQGSSSPSTIVTMKTAGAPPGKASAPTIAQGSVVSEAELRTFVGPSAPYAYQVHECTGCTVAHPGHVRIQWPSVQGMGDKLSYVVEYEGLGISVASAKSTAPSMDLSSIATVRAQAKAGKGKERGQGKLQLVPAIGQQAQTLNIEAGASALLPSLPSNTAWRVRVCARNHIGQGEWSDWSTFALIGHAPAVILLRDVQEHAPEPLRGVALNALSAFYPATCRASVFAVPPPDGGAPFSSVTVQVRHKGPAVPARPTAGDLPGTSALLPAIPAMQACHPRLLDSSEDPLDLDLPILLHSPNPSAVSRLTAVLAAVTGAESTLASAQDDQRPAKSGVQFSVNQKVDVLYSEDGRWYRGAVTGVDEETGIVQVHIGEFGLVMAAGTESVRDCFTLGVSVEVEDLPAAHTVCGVTSTGYLVRPVTTQSQVVADLTVPAHSVCLAKSDATVQALPFSWKSAVMRAKGPAKPLAVVAKKPTAQAIGQEPESSASELAEGDEASDTAKEELPTWFKNFLALHATATSTPSSTAIPATNGTSSLDYSTASWGDVMMDGEDAAQPPIAALVKVRKGQLVGGRVPDADDKREDECGWMDAVSLPFLPDAGPDGSCCIDIPCGLMLPGHTYEIRARVATVLGSGGWSNIMTLQLADGPPTPLVQPAITVSLSKNSPSQPLPPLTAHNPIEDLLAHAPLVQGGAPCFLQLSCPEWWGGPSVVDRGIVVELCDAVGSRTGSGVQHGTGQSWRQVAVAQVTGESATVALVIDKLKSGSAFWIRAAARSSGGQSAWTTPALLRTAAKPCTPPRQVHAQLMPAPAAIVTSLTAGVTANGTVALKLGEDAGKMLVIALSGAALSSYKRAQGEVVRYISDLQAEDECQREGLPKRAADFAKTWPCVACVQWSPPSEVYGCPVLSYSVACRIAQKDDGEQRGEQTSAAMHMSQVGVLHVDDAQGACIQVRDVSSTSPTVVYNGPSSQVALAALTPGCTYSASVCAVTEAGASLWSEEVTITAPVDEPHRPVPPVAQDSSISTSSARLIWSPLSFKELNCGDPVAYYVQRAKVVVADGLHIDADSAGPALAKAINSGNPAVRLTDGTVTRLPAASDHGCSMKLSKLQPGYPYACRLAVENEAGCSDWSEWAVFFTKATGGAGVEAEPEDTPSMDTAEKLAEIGSVEPPAKASVGMKHLPARPSSVALAETSLYATSGVLHKSTAAGDIQGGEASKHSGNKVAAEVVDELSPLQGEPSVPGTPPEPPTPARKGADAKGVLPHAKEKAAKKKAQGRNAVPSPAVTPMPAKSMPPTNAVSASSPKPARSPLKMDSLPTSPEDSSSPPANMPPGPPLSKEEARKRAAAAVIHTKAPMSASQRGGKKATSASSGGTCSRFCSGRILGMLLAMLAIIAAGISVTFLISVAAKRYNMWPSSSSRPSPPVAVGANKAGSGSSHKRGVPSPSTEDREHLMYEAGKTKPTASAKRL